jgi:hypothetical protein
MERLFKSPPNYCMLKIFGCACWPHLRPYNKHKLEFRSKPCVFLGYSSLHKGYKCLDMETGRVYISRDVIFDEADFPFSNPSSNFAEQSGDSSFNLNTNHLQNLLPVNSVHAAPSNAEDPSNVGTATSPERVPRAQSVGAGQQLPCATSCGQQQLPSSGNPPGPHGIGDSPPHAGAAAPDLPRNFPAVDLHVASSTPADFSPDLSRDSGPPPAAAHAGDTAPTTAGPAPTENVAPTDSSPTDSSADSDFVGPIGSPVAPGSPIAADNQQINIVHPYGTRLRNNIRQPKTRTDGTVTYSVSRVSSSEPSSHVTAMEHPLWRLAMQDEFDALIKNKTWHLVPPRAGLNVIDSKWVF